LQRRLSPLFHSLLADPVAPRTVVVVPGLSIDQEMMSRIDGLQHYEERQLTMLMLLRLPNTRLVFVTSTPVDPVIIDYYLNLLPGVPHAHEARIGCFGVQRHEHGMPHRGAIGRGSREFAARRGFSAREEETA